MKIFGVSIENITKEDILENIHTYLGSNSCHQIATVNPEFLLEARINSQFRNILNNCSMRVSDGVGIILAHTIKGELAPERVSGADLTQEILHIATQKKLEVFLAVNKNGLSSFSEIKTSLQHTYPGIIVEGLEYSISDLQDAPVEIPSSCAMALCNFGAPQQEIFLSHLKGDSLRITMGVGGSFDYITGAIRRAPQWMQSLGIEWIWRFIQQPSRYTRICNAVFLFPYKALFANSIGKDHK